MALHICADRQRVLDANAHVLVVGGPGAGKTTLALAKAERQIAALLQGQAVLFLSFSRAAVARVIEASRKQLPKTVQSKLEIQTFHSFFWEVLRGYGYLLGAPRRLRLLQPHDEEAARNEVESSGGNWSREADRLFKEQGLVVFDLFAPKMLALLRGSQKIRSLISSRYPLIVVDEAQDTGSDQWQIVQALAKGSQLICLADLDQQIYDFRPDVSASRVDEIMAALTPERVDLAAQNHRSANSEILHFGNDVLLDTPRGKPYLGVSRLVFHPAAKKRDLAIRRSVGFAVERAKQLSGEPVKSLAVIATWGRGVNILTRALTGDGEGKRIPHRVLIDEAPVLLASRVIAFLLEPKAGDAEEVAQALELCAAVFRAKGKGALEVARTLTAMARDARAGKALRPNSTASRMRAAITVMRDSGWTGDPKLDWLSARKALAQHGSGQMKDIAKYAEQLVAFQRGERISKALAELWQTRGAYETARMALDHALAADQLLDGGTDLAGIHVMTAHKAKGKEFDAVVIFDDPNSSPLIYCREPSPYRRSRRLARVAITRARHHVVVLSCMMESSKLLSGHRL